MCQPIFEPKEFTIRFLVLIPKSRTARLNVKTRLQSKRVQLYQHKPPSRYCFGNTPLVRPLTCTTAPLTPPLLTNLPINSFTIVPRIMASSKYLGVCVIHSLVCTPTINLIFEPSHAYSQATTPSTRATFVIIYRPPDYVLLVMLSSTSLYSRISP